MSHAPLQILPAVDVADGCAVRLVQGEAGSETLYGEPLDAALAWQAGGATWVHLVDLDAANHQRVADAFGETGLGARFCELFAPAGRVLSDEGGTVRATLPEGPPATATVRRPPGAA